jgi:YesN/AraC family two-component response regulator
MHARSADVITILLVEDEAVALQLLATILGKKYPGIALHCAGNGRVGLELFQQHAADIVITDINMPEMSGLQMADRIRTLAPGTRIITLSADTGNLAEPAGPELGTDFYIYKPINFAILFAALEACFAKVLAGKPAQPQQDHGSAQG